MMGNISHDDDDDDDDYDNDNDNENDPNEWMKAKKKDVIL